MNKQKVAKLFRVITIAPIMATVLLSVMWANAPGYVGSWRNYLLSMLFLVVMPVLGYPLQPLLPGFKQRGREGQRDLAIIAAFIGYVASVVVGWLLQVPPELLMICFTYLFTGLLLIVFNKLLHLRASGHACGVAGPISALLWFFGVAAWWGLILYAMVWWASLAMKRHTPSELIVGTLLPVVALFLSLLLMGLL